MFCAFLNKSASLLHWPEGNGAIKYRGTYFSDKGRKLLRKLNCYVYNHLPGCSFEEYLVIFYFKLAQFYTIHNLHSVKRVEIVSRLWTNCQSLIVLNWPKLQYFFAILLLLFAQLLNECLFTTFWLLILIQAHYENLTKSDVVF